MDGFAKRKEQKKESIRRAALELFRSYGFKKVSVSDIAERAGVSPVTIYNHFGSKDELVRDVLKWYALELLERYRSLLESDRPFTERLQDIVFDKSEMASQFQGELLQTWTQNDPAMTAFIEDLYTSQVLPVARKFFEEGLRGGYIDRRFSLETLMIYLEIVRRGFFSMPELPERAEQDPDLLKKLIDLITYGLNG